MKIKVETASQICSAHARLGVAMESKVSMQNQISSGVDEKSQNICYVQKKTKIHFYGQVFGIYQAELESREIYSAKIRDKWNCRASCTTRERRNFVSIGSFWTSKKLVGRRHVLLLRSPPCARATGRRPNALWTMVHFTIWWADYFVWSRSNISFQHHHKTKDECISSVQKSLLEISLDAPWPRVEVGLVIFWSWIQRSCKKTTIWNSCKKIQNKRSGHFQQKRWICMPMQNVRNLSRATAAIYRYLQCGAATPRGNLSKTLQ